MNRGRSLAVALVAAGVVVAPTAAAFADTTTCDAYSGKCTTVQGTKIVKTPTTSVEGTKTATLPFTGGEIVLMTLVGGAALGGGAVLVTAGRRRRTAPSV